MHDRNMDSNHITEYTLDSRIVMTAWIMSSFPLRTAKNCCGEAEVNEIAIIEADIVPSCQGKWHWQAYVIGRLDIVKKHWETYKYTKYQHMGEKKLKVAWQPAHLCTGSALLLGTANGIAKSRVQVTNALKCSMTSPPWTDYCPSSVDDLQQQGGRWHGEIIRLYFFIFEEGSSDSSTPCTR